MTLLWPRLPDSAAAESFAQLEETGQPPKPAVSHPGQVYAQVGGRASPSQIQAVRDVALEAATQHGFPDVSPVSRLQEFDRAIAPMFYSVTPMTWSEAGGRGVWSFMALSLLPDITDWRWQHQATRNRERWVATDLTRHTWGRLWWLMAAYESEPDLAFRFNESELNQLLERRSIGGNPPLLVALSQSILAAADEDVPRRQLIRDVTRRIRRHLAFLETTGLTGTQLSKWTRDQVIASVRSLKEHGGQEF